MAALSGLTRRFNTALISISEGLAVVTDEQILKFI